MKKILSFVLAVAFCLALSTSAFAATVDTNHGTDSGTVRVKLNNGVVDPTDPDDAAYVYNAVVTWESLDFTYTTGAWNPETLTYDNGAWDKNTSTVSVANRSNAPVSVSFKWDDQSQGTLANTVKGATFTMSEAAASLNDASKTTTGLTTTNTITVSGKGDAWTNVFTDFDTIVVTIDSAVA